MGVPFSRIQPTFRNLDEAREQFSRLQDQIERALARAVSLQQLDAPLPSTEPGGQTLTIGNGPDSLTSTSPSRYVALVLDDGSTVLVAGYPVT